MSGWALFFSVFGLIFVAELPDKTALAALVLATRQKPLPVFLGAAGALGVQSVVAVAAGQLISLLPARPVHIFAGILFVVSAVVMWVRHDEASAESEDGKPAAGFFRATWSAFLVVFIAEWGDLTQLATGAMAARYKSPFIVFSAATLALWAVAGLAVVIGHRAGKLLDPELTKKIAAVAFAGLGIALIAGLL
ncbi:MAG TPA: TMEM165/GDT1 family protein [Polyangiaceae bacterium]|jgi:putative Ca2+/H+ antiporter (TMEM165/GDT1 family)|nr:TMEM165/GDT1 family protein [Polyangiaceae bacterium]